MAAKCPWGTDQLCWELLARWDTLGSPGLVSQTCPHPSCLRGTILSGLPRRWGLCKQECRQISGAEKKDGKTQEKTYPLLWLFLLMKSRALPKPEGMEEELSKTPLGKHSPCCRAVPVQEAGGQADNFSELWGQRPASCCSSEPLFLESRQ